MLTRSLHIVSFSLYFRNICENLKLAADVGSVEKNDPNQFPVNSGEEKRGKERREEERYGKKERKGML